MAKKSTKRIGTPRRTDMIVVRGARVHNLKNVNIDIPRKKFIVFTGVSGSGKSSLAFDTIYAEGQRRYVESLSSYARQFLERMDKPDVDLISGISPAMAIEQKTNTRNPRSTVATTTEIYDYLKLLFARVGKTFCANCGNLVTRDSVRTVLDALGSYASALPGNHNDSVKLYVMFPLHGHEKEPLDQVIGNLKKEGFFRIVLGENVLDLNEDPLPTSVDRGGILVLVDRLVYRKSAENGRISDSVETAFASGGGRAAIRILDTGETLSFDQNFGCSTCGISYEEPDPRLFSFNNPFGACPECQGFGRAVGIDMNLVVPDQSKTLADGAVVPWTSQKFKHNARNLARIAAKAGVRMNVPFSELHDEERRVVKEGFGEFDGLDGFFKKIERKSYKIYYRVFLSRYRGYTTCPKCGGARLRQEALNIKIGGKNIFDVVRLTVAEGQEFFARIELSPFELEVGKRILEELRKRLAYLNEVGIGYLTLDRLSNTLSGGESQRINLATSLGSSLVGALYVLDEPSIGLHPRDNEKLITILKALRDTGNTVIVVEHDADMMKASDEIVDLGPGAGEHGGEIVCNGPLAELLDNADSLTGQYLSGRKKIPLPRGRRETNGAAITVVGAAEHNLKNIDVRIPLNMLVCVTGVSGSGKSTLVHDILYNGLKHLKGEGRDNAARYRALEGHEYVSSVELVDQSPIGRTPRSNPITYIQVFDQIRSLFANTQSAKIHGYSPGQFSFNVPGGRCEACEGDGVVKVEMQFLADLYLTCDVCKGKRYKREILGVQYRGKNIDDVLNMTVSEAIRFFGGEASGRKVSQKLKVLEDVGLGYIRLGQPATSLSGGEAQRVKLAAHLAAPRRDQHTLFIFDEPTTGLHFDDIAKLIACFTALLEAGNSVVIIEHNLDVVKCADYIVDLGPEAGEGGGEVVASGTPEEVVRNRRSHTGKFLSLYINGVASRVP